MQPISDAATAPKPVKFPAHRRSRKPGGCRAQRTINRCFIISFRKVRSKISQYGRFRALLQKIGYKIKGLDKCSLQAGEILLVAANRGRCNSAETGQIFRASTQQRARRMPGSVGRKSLFYKGYCEKFRLRFPITNIMRDKKIVRWTLF